METTITAAIIGAIATILAAIIGVLSHRRKVAASTPHFEKSKALRLGYVLAAIECYLEAQKMQITSPPLTEAINAQNIRALSIAETLGLKPHNLYAEGSIRELPLMIDKKSIPVKNTFRIGNIVGRIYFYSISLMATGSLPPIDKDVERISEAEQLLNDAGLPSDFLKPVKNLWKGKLQAVCKGDTRPIDIQMEEILDQLCKSIEIGARHSA
jgi:hypothetical protein